LLDALVEGCAEFVGFSSDPDKKFPILSVKLFSATGGWSSTGSTGHGIVGGGALLPIAQAVRESDSTSINIPDLSIFFPP
jgi:hypothetical protein